MRKDASVWIAVGLLLVAIAIFHTQLGAAFQSIGIGSAATYRFVYINTYNYPGLTQQPAIVSYTYSADHGLGTSAGTCTTQVEYFNLGEYLSELDAPTSTGTYPISQQYSSPSGQAVNIAVCELTLPAQEYNTTSGTLTLQAVGTNGYTSGTYTASLSVESEYSASASGQTAPTIITIPLTTTATTQSTSTTTASTTASSSTSTMQSTATTQSTSTTTASTTTAASTVPPPTPPPQNNIFTDISNFINSIWQAILSAFSL